MSRNRNNRHELSKIIIKLIIIKLKAFLTVLRVLEPAPQLQLLAQIRELVYFYARKIIIKGRAKCAHYAKKLLKVIRVELD